MLVYCNKPYELVVDGVTWSPIGSQNGVDEYVLSTSGFFEILVDGVRQFYFRNVLTPEFSINRVYARYFEGESPQETTPSSIGKYLQSSFPTANRDKVYVYVYPTDMTQIEGLQVECNQGTVVSATPSASWVTLIIANIDSAEHLRVNLGNVLVAFITPFEE